MTAPRRPPHQAHAHLSRLAVLLPAGNPRRLLVARTPPANEWVVPIDEA